MNKEERVKISVVIAIYNVERYIKQCIESVTKSTFNNLEIILVDDGSPDDCPNICDDFAKRDKRIKVLHQKNTGLVGARRNGVKISSGQYVLMIDGDDWIDDNLIEKMYDSIEDLNTDVLICGYSEDRDGVQIIKSNNVKSGLYINEQLDELRSRALSDGVFYNPGVVPAVWCKLFKRDLLTEVQKNIPDLIRMGEDVAITYPILAAANNVFVDNNICGYHYRVVEKSMSRSCDPVFFERANLLINFLNNQFEEYMCQLMLEKLPYYKLFLFKLGAEQKIASYGEWGIFTVVNDIRREGKIIDIKSEWKSIDKKLFEYDVMKYKFLFRNWVWCYVLLVFVDEVRRKLGV